MYPKEYIHYLIHFHGDRDYFECHEILEEYWKKTDPGNKESIWVGFIQLAVASYHHRRKNFKGAERTLGKSIHIFNQSIDRLEEFGLDPDRFQKDLSYMKKQIQEKASYTSYCFPFSDLKLVTQCKKECQKRGLKWDSDSDLENEHLIHRHTLRDRSEVIEERLQALNKKKTGS